jgi:hypothetical protein
MLVGLCLCLADTGRGAIPRRLYDLDGQEHSTRLIAVRRYRLQPTGALESAGRMLGALVRLMSPREACQSLEIDMTLQAGSGPGPRSVPLRPIDVSSRYCTHRATGLRHVHVRPVSADSRAGYMCPLRVATGQGAVFGRSDALCMPSRSDSERDDHIRRRKTRIGPPLSTALYDMYSYEHLDDTYSSR